MSEPPRRSVSVAGVVVREDGHVLAIQRRDNGRWEAPGGVLELGETFEAAVRREVAEETGVSVAVERLTGVYNNVTRHVVALVFRCHPISGTPTATEEARRAEWLTLDEVRERMPVPYAVRVLDALTDGVATRTHDGVRLLGD